MVGSFGCLTALCLPKAFLQIDYLVLSDFAVKSKNPKLVVRYKPFANFRHRKSTKNFGDFPNTL